MLKNRISNTIIIFCFLSNVPGFLGFEFGDFLSSIIPSFSSHSTALRNVKDEKNESAASAKEKEKDPDIYTDDDLKFDLIGIRWIALEQYIARREEFLKAAQGNHPNAEIKQELWDVLNEDLNLSKEDYKVLNKFINPEEQDSDKDDDKSKNSHVEHAGKGTEKH